MRVRTIGGFTVACLAGLLLVVGYAGTRPGGPGVDSAADSQPVPGARVTSMDKDAQESQASGSQVPTSGPLASFVGDLVGRIAASLVGERIAKGVGPAFAEMMDDYRSQAPEEYAFLLACEVVAQTVRVSPGPGFLGLLKEQGLPVQAVEAALGRDASGVMWPPAALRGHKVRLLAEYVTVEKPGGRYLGWLPVKPGTHTTDRIQGVEGATAGELAYDFPVTALWLAGNEEGGFAGTCLLFVEVQSSNDSTKLDDAPAKAGTVGGVAYLAFKLSYSYDDSTWKLVNRKTGPLPDLLSHALAGRH